MGNHWAEPYEDHVIEAARVMRVSPSVAAHLLNDYGERLKSLRNEFIDRFPGINAALAKVAERAHFKSEPLTFRRAYEADFGSILREDYELRDRERRGHHIAMSDADVPHWNRVERRSQRGCPGDS